MIEIATAGVIVFGSVARLSAEDPYSPPALPTLPRTGSSTPPEPPEPKDPIKMRRQRIQRVSEVMPAPTLDSLGYPTDWAPSSVVREVVGRLQIVVEGEDITFFRDAETPFPSWTRAEPFGSQSATIAVPQITGFDALGSGDLEWCVKGASVEIRLIREDGAKLSLFYGFISEFDHSEDSGTFQIQCNGVLYQGDLQLMKPPFVTTPVDAGTAIPRALNSVVGRRYAKIETVSTGVKIGRSASWDPVLTSWALKHLATLVKDKRQWTVKCDRRTPEMIRKDLDTVHATVRNGQRGILVDLQSDLTQEPNVIYGEGIRDDGGRWRNAKFPNWRNDSTPSFPRDPNNSIRVGDTDSTTSGGVSLWEAQVGVTADGVFSQSDRAALMRIQRTAGIQVDGFLGPQSWAASFGTGSNTGTLDDAWIAPLAAIPQVEPHIYSSDGEILGDNPSYDPDVIRVESFTNFGSGVTKSRAVTAAENMLARDSTEGWVGTITFTLDPNEGSKYELIHEGNNIRVRSFRGSSLLVHVASVEYGEDTVTATVDTKARDYPTLAAIMERNRDAQDPARSYRRSHATSAQTSERGTWDAESPGGIIPKLALFNNLWTVLRIPVAEYGEIVRTKFTTSPARPFSVAVFDREITASTLLSIVGNPLGADENPWQDAADVLEDLGMIQAWGWNLQPCGYYPKEYSTPADDESPPPVTGRMLDDGSWTYSSSKPPWVWIAMIAEGSCEISGRLWHGVS